jgi:hypothetical protein
VVRTLGGDGSACLLMRRFCHDANCLEQESRAPIRRLVAKKELIAGDKAAGWRRDAAWTRRRNFADSGDPVALISCPNASCRLIHNQHKLTCQINFGL